MFVITLITRCHGIHVYVFASFLGFFYIFYLPIFVFGGRNCEGIFALINSLWYVYRYISIEPSANQTKRGQLLLSNITSSIWRLQLNCCWQINNWDWIVIKCCCWMKQYIVFGLNWSWECTIRVLLWHKLELNWPFQIWECSGCGSKFSNLFCLFGNYWGTGPWFNITMSSYQYRKSHCEYKTVIRSFYFHNGIS